MAKRPLLLRLYAGVLGFAGPLVAWGVLSWRRRHGKEMTTRIGERRGHASRMRPEGIVIWVHAASVGELISVLPLVGALVDRGFNILTTTGTVTSARLAAIRLPADAIHQFVPLDVPSFARRFFDHWRPDLVIFTESELWPNLFAEAESRAVPVDHRECAHVAEIVRAAGRGAAPSYGRSSKASICASPRPIPTDGVSPPSARRASKPPEI